LDVKVKVTAIPPQKPYFCKNNPTNEQFAISIKLNKAGDYTFLFSSFKSLDPSDIDGISLDFQG